MLSEVHDGGLCAEASKPSEGKSRQSTNAVLTFHLLQGPCVRHQSRHLLRADRPTAGRKVSPMIMTSNPPLSPSPPRRARLFIGAWYLLEMFGSRAQCLLINTRSRDAAFRRYVCWISFENFFSCNLYIPPSHNKSDQTRLISSMQIPVININSHCENPTFFVLCDAVQSLKSNTVNMINECSLRASTSYHFAKMKIGCAVSRVINRQLKHCGHSG